jgi:cell division septation protein DedD
VQSVAQSPVAEEQPFPEEENAWSDEAAEKELLSTSEVKAPVEAEEAVSIPESAPEAAAPAAAAPVKEIKKETARAVAAVTKAPEKAPAAVAAAPKKSSAVTINAATNRYYIIAGGYSSLKNARWGLKQMIGKKGTGKVILPTTSGELHRISVQDFASREEALAQLPELKKEFGNNIWILNY